MKTIFLCTFSLFSVFVYSQSDLKRLEFDLKDNYASETVFSLEENGFLIQSLSKESKEETKELKSDFYTTDLQLDKTVYLNVRNRAKIVNSYYDKEGVYYTLLRDKKNNISIISADAETKTCKQIESKIPEEILLYNMEVLRDKAIFKATKKKDSKIVFIDLNTGEYKEVSFELAGIKARNVSIKDFQTSDEGILVFLGVKVSRSENSLYIAKINKQGVTEEIYKATENPDTFIVSASATKIENNKYIITGTYSTNEKEVSQGLYLAEVENKKLNFIKYYNFLDLKNFTEYLPEKQQKKIEKKKEKAEKKGKEYVLDYNYVVHPVKATEEGYEFLGEAFYPTFYTVYMQIGLTTMASRVFDGFQYSHATLAKFDRQGNIVWDNTFSMWSSYKPFRIVKLMTKRETNKSLDLLYTDRDLIVSKSFERVSGQILKEKSEKVIDTGLEGDKIKRSYSNIEYWYDTYFLVYGTQTISNKEDKTKRRIFFVNKVSTTE